MKQYCRIVVGTLCILAMSASLAFAYVENVRVKRVDHRTVVVNRDNGATFELKIERGCPSLHRYKNRDVELYSDGKFMGANSMIFLRYEREQCRVKSYARLHGPRKEKERHSESVRVTRVRGDHIVLRRDNGVKFDVVVGKGCPAIQNFEGRDVTISSPNKFLGEGSMLFLPNRNQQCRILSHSRR